MASFMDDPAVKAFFARRPLYEQKWLWTFTIQGDLSECKRHEVETKTRPQPERGPIIQFSKRARLRMLKYVATVDWSRIRNGLFITLTYPDGIDWSDPAMRTRAKYLFHRDMEKHLGRKIGFLWRTEWKRRLTGTRIGEPAPHFHLIVPNVRFIDKETIRHFWHRALNWDDDLITWVEKLSDKRHHEVYICKYCAKPEDASVLDYVPYSHRTGGHWGVNRRALIPRCPRIEYEDIPIELVNQLRAVAYRILKPDQQAPHVGFSTFGVFGKKICFHAMKLLLDNGIVPV